MEGKLRLTLIIKMKTFLNITRFLIQALGCADNPSIDCALLSSLINVCDDAEQAMTICPKFCNICPTGKHHYVMYSYRKHNIYDWYLNDKLVTNLLIAIHVFLVVHF